MILNEVSNEGGEVSIDFFPLNLKSVPGDSLSFKMDGSVEVDVGVQVGDGTTVRDQVDVDLGEESGEGEGENVTAECGSSGGLEGSVF